METFEAFSNLQYIAALWTDFDNLHTYTVTLCAQYVLRMYIDAV